MKLRIGTPQEAGVSPSSVQQIIERAAEWVEDGIHPALVILAARRGIVFLHEAMGHLTPANDSPSLSREAIFPIASISKPITATTAMILVEDGLLGLNRPVREYIPEFEGEGKEQVMVHHLLTHTAGIDDEATWAVIDEKEEAAVAVPTCEETQHPEVHRSLHHGFDFPLAKKPGVEMSYSNFGYYLLGEIVRRMSAQSLDSFASERIFKPLGMDNTWYSVPEGVRHRIIQRPPDAPYPEFNDEMQEHPSASGGVYSTALDMAVLGQMFLNQGCYGGARILGPVTVTAMTRNQIPGIPAYFLEQIFPEASWGLGWSINAEFKGEAYGEAMLSSSSYLHTGGTGTLLWIDPVCDIVGVYFSALINTLETVSPIVGDRKNWYADLFMNMVAASADDL
ncbi:MAG: class A beta-lactamase-related serine hydrolase [Anaerolineales bacterium]|nr:MAG: class A beta-lactamase-related serine hydrolase [Anaerolineales bacterium]